MWLEYGGWIGCVGWVDRGYFLEWSVIEIVDFIFVVVEILEGFYMGNDMLLCGYIFGVGGDGVVVI